MLFLAAEVWVLPVPAQLAKLPGAVPGVAATALARLAPWTGVFRPLSLFRWVSARPAALTRSLAFRLLGVASPRVADLFQQSTRALTLRKFERYSPPLSYDAFL